MFEKKTVLLLGMLLSAVLFVYLGHFGNGFHFDDVHTIVQNPYIRDWHNIPRFFADAKTFSVLPRNRVYRPLVSASLAIDYWLGDGLKPFFCQLSTFCWFLVQLVLMYALFRKICDLARPDPRNRTVALLATAWFGLHPAAAETVNYVIQRADLYSTLGVIAALLIYGQYPGLRKYGLYLLPFAAGVLSKPPALIFPAMLFVYVWLFEENADVRKLGRVLFRCWLAFAAAGALAWFLTVMTPKEFNPGMPLAYAYRITQPLVALRYFRTFFLPGRLTADSDLSPIPSVWKDGAWMGFVFVFLVVAAAIICSKRREWRPVAFGLWWFLLALVPTSLFPLAEVENDHRMFFPFVGLVLSASWPVALWIFTREAKSRVFSVGVALVCACELAVLALGTVQRNLVWRTDESLWHDVAIKSPQDARGLVSYGIALLNKGEPEKALVPLEQARNYAPRYALLHQSLGIAYGRLKQNASAEEHFRRGIQIDPTDPAARNVYAEWLGRNGRPAEAIEQLRLAVKLNPDFLGSFYLLMGTYATSESWPTLRDLAEEVLARFPSDSAATSYRLLAAWKSGEFEGAEPAVKRLETAENFLGIFVLYYQAAQFEQAIAAAGEALRLRPNYPEAYNDIGAAERALGNWDAAAEAATQALRLRQSLAAAKENLARARAHNKDQPTP